MEGGKGTIMAYPPSPNVLRGEDPGSNPRGATATHESAISAQIKWGGQSAWRSFTNGGWAHGPPAPTLPSLSQHFAVGHIKKVMSAMRPIPNPHEGRSEKVVVEAIPATKNQHKSAAEDDEYRCQNPPPEGEAGNFGHQKKGGAPTVKGHATHSHPEGGGCMPA